MALDDKAGDRVRRLRTQEFGSLFLANPVEVQALSSEAYWRKWSRVSEEHIQEIAKRFFFRVHELEPDEADL